jgi:hypothetical protein
MAKSNLVILKRATLEAMQRELLRSRNTKFSGNVRTVETDTSRTVHVPTPPTAPTVQQSRGLPDRIFPVTVEKTGGSDGTKTSAASWTYTVKDLSGTELGTGVSVARPRPYGTVTFQASTTGYGLAFYDNGTLKLWDAGEKPGSGGCA